MKFTACKLILLLVFFSGIVIAEATMAANAYDFSFQRIDESGELNLADYKGKVIMVVNTASLCGFTKQYADLERLYEKYKDKGFVIIAVPSNNFGKQEPEDNKSIKNFCQVNFGIKFPLAAKLDVKGKASHPFFGWTRQKLGFWSGPKWNFYKYLIDKDGELVTWFSSFTSPNSEKVMKAIEAHL